MIVNFMIVGAQKCGTTSLAQQLSAHPEVCFSSIKEPGYFNAMGDWLGDINSYHDLFSPQPDQICGEASTMYTFLPEFQGTAERIHAYNPSMKLIYMMRDPVERIISNYTHELVRGRRLAEPGAVVFSDPGYVNRSRYAVQIRPYLELFGRAQILLLVFEEYVHDTDFVLTQIAEFLNIDPSQFPTREAFHAHRSVGAVYLKSEALRTMTRTSVFQAIRNYVPLAVRQPLRRKLGNQVANKPEFSATLQHTLWRFVEDDVGEIERLMGRRLDMWRATEWST